MCPVCAGSIMMMAGSVMSAGGLTALVVNKFRLKREQENPVNKSKPKEEAWAK